MIIHTKYSPNRQKGNIAEDLACLFLMKRSFQILERNYLKPWGEIDIVAQKDGQIHFVEVKAVSCEIERPYVSRETVTRETIRPEDNMTAGKGNRLKRVIASYLRERKVSPETPYQVDLVTVRFDQTTKIAIAELFERVL